MISELSLDIHTSNGRARPIAVAGAVNAERKREKRRATLRTINHDKCIKVRPGDEGNGGLSSRGPTWTPIASID